MNNSFKITLENLKKQIDVAMKRKDADLIFKNAKYVNVFLESIETADIVIADGVVVAFGKPGEYKGKVELDMSGKILSPALMDSHIHLESAIVSPKSFRDIVVPHGTCAVIADPHEITNVAGEQGLDYMIEMSKDLDLRVLYGIPSCVPSTPLDEAGAVLTAADMKKMYAKDRIYGIGEMMNLFGIVHNDEECLKKCIDCRDEDGLLDGHAPMVVGENLDAYLCTGIDTDHECETYEEGLEKLSKGEWIEIREGTACKNLSSLVGLIKAPYHNRCMFSTDDGHPDYLREVGHIDAKIRMAIEKGVDPILAIKVGSFNTARHYRLRKMGAIGIGYKADIIVLDDLNTFKINSVYLSGEKVAENGKAIKKFANTNNTLDKEKFNRVYDSYHMEEITPDKLSFGKTGTKQKVIVLEKGGVVTNEEVVDIAPTKDGLAYGVDHDRDILKVAVFERHKNTGHIGLGFIKGYGLRGGAVATSIAHDSHNLIVVGDSDESIALAANTVRKNKGGIAVIKGKEVLAELKLEVAGIMTEQNEDYVVKTMDDLKDKTYNELNCSKDYDPFMTLAFMSLPVIPRLKIITTGLVEVATQEKQEAVF